MVSNFGNTKKYLNYDEKRVSMKHNEKINCKKPKSYTLLKYTNNYNTKSEVTL